MGIMAHASRMTSFQRREQLISVGRSLFASKGFEAVSVEEIAASAKVSKPIVYEHFGGKEGLYAVVVDREMRALTDALAKALAQPEAHPRQIVERTALALLTYIEEDAEGFQVLVRDSPSTDPAGSFSSLLGDVSMRVEEILTDSFKRLHLPSKGAPYYAQMLVGMTVFTGQYWADRRKISKEQLAAHIVNLAWYGLSRLESRPELRYESDKARRATRQAARTKDPVDAKDDRNRKDARNHKDDKNSKDDKNRTSQETQNAQEAENGTETQAPSGKNASKTKSAHAATARQRHSEGGTATGKDSGPGDDAHMDDGHADNGRTDSGNTDVKDSADSTAHTGIGGHTDDDRRADAAGRDDENGENREVPLPDDTDCDTMPPDGPESDGMAPTGPEHDGAASDGPDSRGRATLHSGV